MQHRTVTVFRNKSPQILTHQNYNFPHCVRTERVQSMMKHRSTSLGGLVRDSLSSAASIAAARTALLSSLRSPLSPAAKEEGAVPSA